MHSTPCPDPALLQRLLTGALPSALDVESIAQHLESCAACAARLQRLPDEDRLLAVARGPLGDSLPPAEAFSSLLRQLKGLRTGSFGATADTPHGEGLTPPPRERTADYSDILDPPTESGELGRIGPYRVLRELGRGGMGVVYQAEDTELKRLVALKLMKPSLAAEPTARQRFRHEAQAMAALEHDHVVAVYQVGEQRGVPFFAMPFLKGETLEARLKREPRLALAEVLRIGREVAEGLAAAHAHNLIHRDVKPSNIWLETRPSEPGDLSPRSRIKILDFGLARPASGEVHLTQAGMIVGTPAYMAPEQAQGEPVDHRCDLFSLACVLYQMLVGQPPFTGNTHWAVLHAVTTAEPPLSHEKRPETPLPLSHFIGRMLSKDREKRPATAREVIWALTTLAGKRDSGSSIRPVPPDAVAGTAASPGPSTAEKKEPVLAAPSRRRYALKRWLAAAVLVGVVVMAAQIIIRIRHKDGSVTEIKTDQDAVVEVQKDKTVVKVGGTERPNRPKEEKKPAPAKDGGPQPAVKKPEPPVPKPDPTTAAIADILQQIEQHRAARPAAAPSPLDSLRRENVPALARKIAGDPPELVAVLGDNHLRGKRIALSPDGSRIAAVAPGYILIGQARDGAILQMLKWPSGVWGDVRVRYSPDGKYLVSASFGHVILWDARTGTQRREFKGKEIGDVECLAFSPDGQRLAFTDNPLSKKVYEVIVWDLATDKTKRLQGHTVGVHGVCFSPDGRRLASAAGESFKRGELIVWDVTSGSRVYGKTDYKSEVQKVAYSPDGKFLALGHGYQDCKVRLLDAATGEERRILEGNGSLIQNLAFDRKGGRLASANWDNAVRLWDVNTGKLLQTFRDHIGPVNSVCFSPDGGWLLSAGGDQRVLGRDLTNGKKLFQHRGHTDPIVDLAVSLDGKRLASAGEGASLLWWDLATGEETERLPVPANSRLAFGPGGLLVAGRVEGPEGKGILTVWDGRKGAKLRDLGIGSWVSPWFSRDGRYLACRYWGQGDKVPLKVWDLRDGRLVSLAAITFKDRRFSPDGRRRMDSERRRVLTVGDDVGAVVDLFVSGYGKDPVAYGWSPDGRYLVGTYQDRGSSAYRGDVVVWDAHTGSTRLKIPLEVLVEHAVFAPDGRHLIVGTGLGWIYIFRLPGVPKSSG